MVKTTYGQRGGEGPTRGMKATRYTFTYPNGQPGIKCVFKFDDEEGRAYIYEHGGAWYCATVAAAGEASLGHYQTVPAYRVKA